MSQRLYLIPEGTVEMIEELSPRAASIIRDHEITEECKFCDKPVLESEAHFHQGGWVCDQCWDPRLQVTQ